jgi:hypothetical protein
MFPPRLTREIAALSLFSKSLEVVATPQPPIPAKS